MILKKFIPDLHVKSIYDIDLDALKKRGVKGIITDLDNTLIEWDRPDATEELVEWAGEVEKKGIDVVIVSNNTSHSRVASFGETLGVQYISRAKKPSRAPFQRAVEQMGINRDQVVVIGDQLLTDIFGGNRLELYTILVVPVTESDGFFTRFNRWIEHKLLNRLRKRGMIDWEE